MARDRFPTGVAEELKWYVYRLIDPRNGETFYVGKGRGDRIFAHAKGSLDNDPQDGGLQVVSDPKLQRIREIQASGMEVAHVVHRHGIESERIAFEIEAALIDAYPGLTNQIRGQGARDYGSRHVEEIIAEYAGKEFEVSEPLMLISIGKRITSAPFTTRCEPLGESIRRESRPINSCWLTCAVLSLEPFVLRNGYPQHPRTSPASKRGTTLVAMGLSATRPSRKFGTITLGSGCPPGTAGGGPNLLSATATPRTFRAPHPDIWLEGRQPVLSTFATALPHRKEIPMPGLRPAVVNIMGRSGRRAAGLVGPGTVELLGVGAQAGGHTAGLQRLRLRRTG